MTTRILNGIPDEHLRNVTHSVMTFLSEMEVVPVLIGGCALAARGCEKMGLAPSRHASFPGNLDRCEVPVPIFSQPLRGVACATSDIDLLVNCDQSKLRETAKCVKAAGHRIDVLSEQALRDGASAELRFYQEGIQIDLIPTTGAREKQVYARATMESWMGMELRVASLADVVVEKLRAGRTKNLKPFGPIIKAKLSDSERRDALRDCHDLGLMATYGSLIRDILGG